MIQQRTYPDGEAVDFVVVGSGAAGGVLARELATAGFQVVVLEQGGWTESHDFRHDEVANWFLLEGLSKPAEQSFRRTAADVAQPGQPGAPPPVVYATGVGGSSVHFTGNYWRFRPVDFKERSLLGPIAGTGFADWPISYEELEPYYTRVDWEIGVSGAPGPFDAPRSRPYPLPPMPVKSSGVLLERGARALGLHPQPAPVAILSRPYGGRSACNHCGFCMLYGCEYGAKSSTLVTMIPQAVATGNCEVRTLATAMRVETTPAGRVDGVVYRDRDGVEHKQLARAVVLAANGAETPRLLLLSASARHPDGLANTSGLVGRYLMWNAHGETFARFAEPLNEYKSIQATRVVHDFYDADPARGFYGGGGMDGRMIPGPVLFSLFGLPPDAPRWGAEYKRMLGEYFTHTMEVASATTSLAVEENGIELEPGITDAAGRPGIRVTYRDHPDDLAMVAFLQERAIQILEAAGADRVWNIPAAEQTIGSHLLGTARMGDDPRTSVVDRYHRAHDVGNLFICDGSSFVTSGRGQPTMTIQALAFRAAEHMGRLARAGELT